MRHAIRAALIVLVAAAAAAAQQPVRYRVSFPAPEHHYAQVEVDLHRRAGRHARGADEPLVAGPLCGARVLEERLRRAGVRRQGAELTPSRPNPYQWNVSGHDGTVRIAYKVFGDHVDGTYLGVDDDARAHEHAGDADVGARLRHAARRASPSSRRPAATWKAATQLFPDRGSAGRSRRRTFST